MTKKHGSVEVHGRSVKEVQRLLAIGEAIDLIEPGLSIQFIRHYMNLGIAVQGMNNNTSLNRLSDGLFAATKLWLGFIPLSTEGRLSPLAALILVNQKLKIR